MFFAISLIWGSIYKLPRNEPPNSTYHVDLDPEYYKSLKGDALANAKVSSIWYLDLLVAVIAAYKY